MSEWASEMKEKRQPRSKWKTKEKERHILSKDGFAVRALGHTCCDESGVVEKSGRRAIGKRNEV